MMGVPSTCVSPSGDRGDPGSDRGDGGSDVRKSTKRAPSASVTSAASRASARCEYVSARAFLQSREV